MRVPLWPCANGFSEAVDRHPGSRARRRRTSRRGDDLDRRQRRVVRRRRAPRYPRVVGVRVSLPSDRSFASYEEAMAHMTGPRYRKHGTLLEPGTARRPVRVPDTVGQLRVFDPPGTRALGVASGHRASVPAARRRDSRLRILRRSRSGPARSAVAPGGAAFVKVGILPHPGRHRPPAIPALPGDPVPALPLAGRRS